MSKIPFTKSETLTILEVARVALANNLGFYADKLDVPDVAMEVLRKMLNKHMGEVER